MDWTPRSVTKKFLDSLSCREQSLISLGSSYAEELEFDSKRIAARTALDMARMKNEDAELIKQLETQLRDITQAWKSQLDDNSEEVKRLSPHKVPKTYRDWCVKLEELRSDSRLLLRHADAEIVRILAGDHFSEQAYEKKLNECKEEDPDYDETFYPIEVEHDDIKEFKNWFFETRYRYADTLSSLIVRLAEDLGIDNLTVEDIKYSRLTNDIEFIHKLSDENSKSILLTTNVLDGIAADHVLDWEMSPIDTVQVVLNLLGADKEAVENALDTVY